LPSNKKQIIEKLIEARMVVFDDGLYCITNLGGILFAKNFTKIKSLVRKAPRVVIYEGIDKTKTIKEVQGSRGYAKAFPLIIDFINNNLPTNEIIKKALREETKMYPEIAIRELVANALVHQDLFESGTSPMIEIYKDRIEITNPGKALIEADRFIDHMPKSRNEDLASFMRQIKICEERGSGIDKVISSVEIYQLPAPKFEVNEKFTKVTLYGYKKLKDMDREDKIRACQQHCILKYISGDLMNNTSLRKRFNIKERNYSTASRIIAETVRQGLIKIKNPDKSSKKYITYVPIWAY
jgi:predicted HTH transcriptional regulator